MPDGGGFVRVPTFSRNLMNRTDFSQARISKGKLFVFAPSLISAHSLPVLFSGSAKSLARGLKRNFFLSFKTILDKRAKVYKSFLYV